MGDGTMVKSIYIYIYGCLQQEHIYIIRILLLLNSISNLGSSLFF